MFLATFIVGLSAGVPTSDHIPSRAEAFVANALHIAHYRAVAADLNGDRRLEMVVYATEPWRTCGSGGCNLYILTPDGRSYRVVTKLTVARPPVRVLATSTHGWHDLGVLVAGGGILRAYEARLRFDGRSYPRNPTVAPAGSAGRVSGRTILK